MKGDANLAWDWRARLAVIIPIVFLAGLLGGCGEDGGSPPSEGQTTAAEPAAPAANDPSAPAGPTVEVQADKTHAVQPGDEITLTIDVTDFRLSAAAMGAENEAGVGHYRVYLDDAGGDDYLTAGDATTARVTVPEQVTDGSHELRVVLHNNDGSPLEPPAEGRVWLIVYRL